MHSITTLTELQQVAQHDYYEVLVITQVNVGNEIFHMLQVKRIGHPLHPSKSAPAKAGGRLSAYSATNRNVRRSIAESNREHKAIVGISWRVVVTTFTLNCMCCPVALLAFIR